MNRGCSTAQDFPGSRRGLRRWRWAPGGCAQKWGWCRRAHAAGWQGTETPCTWVCPRTGGTSSFCALAPSCPSTRAPGHVGPRHLGPRFPLATPFRSSPAAPRGARRLGICKERCIRQMWDNLVPPAPPRPQSSHLSLRRGPCSPQPLLSALQGAPPQPGGPHSVPPLHQAWAHRGVWGQGGSWGQWG